MKTAALQTTQPFHTMSRVTLPVRRGLVFVSPRNIIRCEANGNYTHVCLVDERKLMIAKTLSQLEEMLDARSFLRIHHSHIINREYLVAYVKGSGGYVVLTDGSEIGVSREKKAAFLENLDYL